MSATSAPAHQHGTAWLEAVMGDGFTATLQDGLNRSRYSRTRQPADLNGPSAAALSRIAAEPDHGDRVWSERRRPAREVHDELGTALSTAARRIELHAIETAETSHLDAARHAIQKAIDITRRLTGGLQEQTVLRPLIQVLQEFAAGAAPESTQVRFKTTGDERLLSDVCRRELFLAVREALRNTFRHARAGQVTVALRFTRRWAHAGITDDGVGFDTGDLLAPGHRAPGLRSMTDRIDDLCGRLTIASTPGTGTRVEVHLPLRPQK
ncbi:ATP-binding protein [Streptomyces sp. A3M-1-3]|uniref:sensor histidine kinase n=1 Tax=Streptomyces sp. A3M-1-3 TaxID=2962044 RepID=UPI0020B7DB5D|nr:ATP-binding protein [Streptomyces sp. A3M-1-3]MCP3817865.1 ATP-binding protein [Streptomyces sp. A3M-1-3]